MAKANDKRTAALPAGFKKIETRGWDPDEQPLLIGTIVSFGKVPRKDFRDGNYVPGSTQQICRVRQTDGKIAVVYESGGLGQLFDLGVGETVAIAYTGTKVIEGREKPMRVFDVGVSA